MILFAHIPHLTPIKPRSLNCVRYYFFITTLVFLLNSNIAFASNRIVSLIPSSTELLFAIGFGNEIVAVSNYCNYPEDKIKDLPRIGDQTLNVEKILSLSPTILVDTNSIHKRYENIFKRNYSSPVYGFDFSKSIKY